MNEPTMSLVESSVAQIEELPQEEEIDLEHQITIKLGRLDLIAKRLTLSFYLKRLIKYNKDISLKLSIFA
jgi:Zn finger protein HypA/HybF involved in hydrogenase expression